MNKIAIGLLTIFSISILSCVARKNKKVSSKENSPQLGLREMYRVEKIDSIKNVYLIYALKDSVLYKIVSLKDSIACTAIKVGEKYAFVLQSRVSKNYKGIDVSPNTIPHITGIMYNGVWINFESSSNYDVFTSYNLKGLCIQ